MPASAPHGYPSPLARMMHVLELRREGRTYREIGDRVGIDPSKVPALITRSIRKVLRETAEEVRQIELSRVEALIVALWEQALKDVTGPKPDFQRFDRVKQLLETKLKFCGAQAVLENNSDNRVQIIVQQFTDRRPKESAYENPNSVAGLGAPAPSNACVVGHGGADHEHPTPSPSEVWEG